MPLSASPQPHASIVSLIERMAFRNIGLDVDLFQPLHIAVLLLSHLHFENGDLVFAIGGVVSEFD